MPSMIHGNSLSVGDWRNCRSGVQRRTPISKHTTPGRRSGGFNKPVGMTLAGLGRRASTTYPSGRVATQTYTLRSQLSQVTLAGEVIATFVHDAAGRETTRTLGNGLARITHGISAARTHRIAITALSSVGRSSHSAAMLRSASAP